MPQNLEESGHENIKTETEQKSSAVPNNQEASEQQKMDQ